jgi:hypothetical protein
MNWEQVPWNPYRIAWPCNDIPSDPSLFNTKTEIVAGPTPRPPKNIEEFFAGTEDVVLYRCMEGPHKYEFFVAPYVATQPSRTVNVMF